MILSFYPILRKHSLSFFSFSLWLSLGFFPVHAKPQGIPESLIQLVLPREGEEVVSKKPLIRCLIKEPFRPEKLLVLLDGVDISALLSVTPEGFEYRPLGVLVPGNHTLSVIAYTTDGKELKREFTFSTRHSKPFEEVYSGNEVTFLYEKLLGNSEESTDQPSWRTESNLASESKLRQEGWEFVFKTNVRHFDQHLRVLPPLEKGFSLVNYLFQGKHMGKGFSFLGETGDIQVTETSNTVQGLARRGASLAIQSRDLHLQLRSFVVKSEQVFGFKGGMGVETSSDDHIMGVSGELVLLSDQLRVRTIYVKGGEEGDSLGISTTGGKKRGDVLGLLLSTDLLKQKVKTEAEFDLSRFDGDCRDEFPAERDKAYRLKIGGSLGRYTYEALYEYMGPDYEVIGNQGLQKNREGFSVKGGANYQIHLINLSLSRYNDNVNRDDLYPRTYTYQGTVDYTLNTFQSLPLGFSYQKSILDSRWEPPDVSPLKTETDMVTGRMNFVKGPFNFGVSATYSTQNDLTATNHDTTNVTLTFTPVVTIEKPYLSISPSLSFNRSTARPTHVRTDLYTNSLDLRGGLFDKKLTYGLGATYSISKTSDRSTNQDVLSSSFNLSYLLVKNLWGFLNPSVGIRGLYHRRNDRLQDVTDEEWGIFLVVQATMPFSF